MDGKKESYLDMVARNINGLMTSDGQRAAFGGYTFTNEEKEQLFGSASAPKRNESISGYDAHNNPLTRKESDILGDASKEDRSQRERRGVV